MTSWQWKVKMVRNEESDFYMFHSLWGTKPQDSIRRKPGKKETKPNPTPSPPEWLLH